MPFTRAHAGILAAILLAAGGGFITARMLDPHGAQETHGERHGDAKEAGEPVREGFVALKSADAPAAGVEVVRVERGGGLDLILPGRVAPAINAQSTVGAPLDGVVVRIHVSVGQKVARGAPIASMRSPEGGAMRAQVDAARSALVAVEARNARDKRLWEEGATSRQDWEASIAAAEEARSRLRAAEAQAEAMGSPDAGGVTVIRSAISGVVTRIPTSPGAVLDDGMEIATIADASRTELVFDAPPASLAMIAPGDHLEARWTGGQAIDAEITGVAPGAAGGQALVRARAMGQTPATGTVISGRVVGNSGERLSVPSEAVQTIGGSASVFIADAHGFRAQHVVAGRTSNGRTEIISGLEGHESIAGRGAFLLKAELGKGEAEHEH